VKLEIQKLKIEPCFRVPIYNVPGNPPRNIPTHIARLQILVRDAEDTEQALSRILGALS